MEERYALPSRAFVARRSACGYRAIVAVFGVVFWYVRLGTSARAWFCICTHDTIVVQRRYELVSRHVGRDADCTIDYSRDDRHGVVI